MTRLIVSCIAGLGAAALPVWVAFTAWSWVVDQVPASDYAGLIKIGITIIMAGLFGGATIWLAILGFIFGGGLVACITGALK